MGTSVSITTTQISGSLRLASACTVRVTCDGDTSDLALAAGTLLVSHGYLLTAWQLVLTADIPGRWALELLRQSDGTCYVQITSPDNNPVDVAWSHSGDGSALRDWLGFSGDLSGAASPAVAPDVCSALWQAETAAQVLQRNSVSRARSSGLVLSGASRTQHNTSQSTADATLWDVTFWAGPTAPHAEQGGFAGFLDGTALLGCGELLGLSHGGTEILGVLETDDVVWTPVQEGWDGLWQARFQVREVDG